MVAKMAMCSCIVASVPLFALVRALLEEESEAAMHPRY